MPRPEQDPDEHDAQYDDHPRSEVVREGNPGTPQSEYLVDDDALRADVQSAIDDANTQVSHAEQIKKFVIVPEDWTEEGGQLTPSLKLKRNVVAQQNADEIAGLYAR